MANNTQASQREAKSGYGESGHFHPDPAGIGGGDEVDGDAPRTSLRRAEGKNSISLCS